MSTNINLTDTAVDLLKQGLSVEIIASGYSMFPSFLPGDIVTVRRIDKELSAGNVVVALDKPENGHQVLVMHRLIEINTNSAGSISYITRGDARDRADEPRDSNQIIGIACSIRRGRRSRAVKSFVPTGTRYRFNIRLLWLCSKLRIV